MNQSAPAGNDSRPALTALLEVARQIILGKDTELTLALCCLLAGGHLLIEDMPGVGKTTLAECLAHLLGLDYQRVQFTSDLLPADIVGATIFERQTERFRPHFGPIFTHLLLADEINRATPRAQSALLEAMEERQVTLDGTTHALPSPFFVIATQNPREQTGTYPLPESQLDRFLLRISLGYPDPAAERQLLQGADRRSVLRDTRPLLNALTVQELQHQAARVYVAEPMLDYVQRVLAYSRQGGLSRTGLSPRAGLGVLRAAKAWALLAGRHHVVPDDLQAILPSAIGHRLLPSDTSQGVELARRLIEAVPIP